MGRLFFSIIKLLLFIVVASKHHPEDLSNTVIFKEHGTLYAPADILHVTFAINNNDLKDACIHYDDYIKELKTAVASKDLSNIDKNNLLTQVKFLEHKIKEACRTPFSFAHIATQPNQTSSRQPRFLGAVAALVGAMAATTGLGIYNTVQINSLYDKVNELQEGMNFFSDNFLILQDIQNQVSGLQQEITGSFKHMQKVVEIVKRRKVTMLHINAAISEFANHVNNLEKVINKFERGYTQLQNNKLSLDLIQPEELNAIWHQITRNSSVHVKALFPSPLDLLHLPATYAFTTSNQLQVFVHVPLTATKFTLFKYVPFPVIPQGAQSPLIIRPRNEKYFFAKTNGHAHVELSQYDLNANCYAFLNNFVCDELSVFNTLPSTTCLSALYNSNQRGIDKLCQVNNFAYEFASHNIDFNKFLLFSRSQTNYKIHCPYNQTKFTGQLLYLHKMISIDPHCHIEAEHFHIQSTAMSQFKSTSTFPIYLNFTTLAKTQDLRELDLIHAELLQLREPEIQLKEIVRKVRSAYVTASYFPHWPTNIAIISLAVVKLR